MNGDDDGDDLVVTCRSASRDDAQWRSPWHPL